MFTAKSRSSNQLVHVYLKNRSFLIAAQKVRQLQLGSAKMNMFFIYNQHQLYFQNVLLSGSNVNVNHQIYIKLCSSKL